MIKGWKVEFQMTMLWSPFRGIGKRKSSFLPGKGPGWHSLTGIMDNSVHSSWFFCMPQINTGVLILVPDESPASAGRTSWAAMGPYPPKHHCCTGDRGGKWRGDPWKPVQCPVVCQLVWGPWGLLGKSQKEREGKGEREGEEEDLISHQGRAACACQGQNCWLFPGATFYGGEESQLTCSISFWSPLSLTTTSLLGRFPPPFLRWGTWGLEIKRTGPSPTNIKCYSEDFSPASPGPNP